MSGNMRRMVILITVLLVDLPVMMDMTILHIAIPSLTLALKATSTEILWIIDIYPLLMTGLLIPAGTLADRIGHKKMLITGLIVFLAASIMAAFSPTAFALIMSRVILAVGAAMIIPSVLAIVRQTFVTVKGRSIALGLWSTVTSIGSAVAPLIGGFLLEHFHWGSVFLINVPFILLILPAAFFYIPENKKQDAAQWRIADALILISGLITTVYALKSFFKEDTPIVLSIALIIIGLIILVWFIGRQIISKEPMLDFSLFKHPAVSTGLIMAVVVAGALTGVEFTIAQELQFVIGKTPLEAGIFMMPLMLGAMVGGPLAGYAVAYVGLRLASSLSLLFSALSLAGLGMISFSHSSFMIVFLLSILGLALSIGLTASSIAIMGSTPNEKAGAAAALEGTGYELGSGLGITFFGLMLAIVYSSALNVPVGIDPETAHRAARSIGDTMIMAEGLSGSNATDLINAGKAAFSSAHSYVLFTAAVLIFLQSLLTFATLKNYKQND